MGENYKAWNIDLKDFYKIQNEKEKIEFLLKFAVLAPSSHNSQPWKFSVSHNSIEIYFEEARRLKESDRNDRQAFISIGCAIKNILIAADFYGYKTELKLSNSQNNQVAKVVFQKVNNEKKTEKHLANFIAKRVTNRNKYFSGPDKELLQIVNNLNNTDTTISFVNEEQKKEVVDTALKSSILATKDLDFRFELAQYVKSNNTKSKIGMPCFGLGIPRPMSFFAPFIIRKFNVNKLNQKKDRKLLEKYTPSLVVISSKSDDRYSWINVGMIYEEIALEAEKRGLNTAMWAAPIQIGEFYKDLQKIMSTDFRPQALLRLGCATKKTLHSPRLDVEEVMV